jgi:hypothetical protein
VKFEEKCELKIFNLELKIERLLEFVNKVMERSIELSYAAHELESMLIAIESNIQRTEKVIQHALELLENLGYTETLKQLEAK